MELVEGPTLADRVASGALAVVEALPIARQIAKALEAAHEHGIVHRDLKPANIKVRADGTVKVLDFGLAKTMNAGLAGREALTDSPTITPRGPLTGAGTLLGTPAYMSPEQVRGSAVDRRADLWAFGVVLFEMLTGTRLFDGATISDTIVQVLTRQPDWASLSTDTPEPTRTLLRRCLEKDPQQRLDSAAAARLEIEDAISASARTKIGIRRRGLAQPNRLAQVSARPLSYTPFSFELGGNSNGVWSPDGKGIAFAARSRSDEPFQVYVRYLDSSVSTPLTHGDTSALPLAWTRAGRIVFRTPAHSGGLWSISHTGGEPEFLLPWRRQAGVSLDGRAIAYFEGAERDGKTTLWISDPAGSPPARYGPAPFEDETLVNQPQVLFSPDGTQLLLLCNLGRGEEAWLAPYPGKEGRPPRRIFATTMPPSAGTPQFSWMPDSRRVVMAIDSGFEPSRLYVADTVSGAFSLLTSGTTAQEQPAVAPDGSCVVFTEVSDDHDVLTVDVETGAVSPLIATRRSEDMPAWSLNSPVMAYVTDRTGTSEIWLHRPGQRDGPAVTGREFPARTTQFLMSPLPSPDGTRLIFTRIDRDFAVKMWLLALSGGSPVRVTDARDDLEFAGAWSPDGAWCAYYTRSRKLCRVRTTGHATPEVLASGITTNVLTVPVWSPTGEWILYDHDGWHLVSPDGRRDRDLAFRAQVCAFSRDGSQLYGIQRQGRRFQLVSRLTAGDPERVVASLDPDQIPASHATPSLKMTLTPDGRCLTFSARKNESNLWLLNGIRPRR
jgi:hypothetical protein